MRLRKVTERKEIGSNKLAVAMTDHIWPAFLGTTLVQCADDKSKGTSISGELPPTSAFGQNQRLSFNSFVSF